MQERVGVERAVRALTVTPRAQLGFLTDDRRRPRTIPT
jgi:hypothetical protein